MTQCALEEATELMLGMRGFTTYAETISVYGTEPVGHPAQVGVGEGLVVGGGGLQVQQHGDQVLSGASPVTHPSTPWRCLWAPRLAVPAL